MESPIVKGGRVELRFDVNTFIYKDKDIESVHFYYVCIESGMNFTTGELDEINISLIKLKFETLYT